MAEITATADGQSLIGDNAPDDIMSADFNNLTIEGRGGDDTITLGTSSGTEASGGEGEDYFSTDGGSNLTLNGNQGDDIFEVFHTPELPETSDSQFDGEEGADSFFVEAGSNLTMNGGTGEDVFVLGEATGSTFNGGDDADTFSAGVSTGSSFNGDAGDDVFSLDAGDLNTFDGGDGIDTVFLWDSFDEYSYSTAVDGTITIASDCTCYTNYVVNVEFFAFSEGVFSTIIVATGDDQVLVGTSDNDALSAKDFTNVTLSGFGGSDLFFARDSFDSTFNGGTDTDYFDAQDSTNGIFNGDEGDDQFLALESVDGTFNGGTGDDSFYAEMSSGATFNGGEGEDSFEADSSDSLLANGGDDNDSFFGGDSTDGEFNGEAGSDYFAAEFSTGGTFSGGFGDDEFYADYSIDVTFNGDAGEDFMCACDSTGGTFNGGADNDILEAEASFNGVFNGDAGDDTFYVETATDATFNGGTGNDTFAAAWEGVENLGTITIDGGDDTDSVLFEGALDTFDIVKTADSITLTKDGTSYVITNVETFEFTDSEGTQTYTFDDIPCFIAGTLIATPYGEKPVETLEAGDLIRTADGAVKPVRWLGRKTVSTIGNDPLRVYPICVRAGALGENRPIRDLYLSPDHALLVDGLLIQAGALVNGVNIVRHLDMPKSFIYYHIEVEGHDLILADGAPAETFVNNITRMTFDNWQECPTFGALVDELDLARAKSWRQVPGRIHQAILQRAKQPCDLVPATAE